MDKQIEKNLEIIKEVQKLERLNETPLFTWDDMQKAKREAKLGVLLTAITWGIFVGFLAFVILEGAQHHHLR